MKKAVIFFCILAFIGIAYFGVSLNEKQTHTEYLRIHIRANSNSEVDQNVKYKVKDAVTDYLTPYLINVNSKKEAEELLCRLDGEIERVADNVLKENGFTYKTEAQIRNEKFPTRVYEDFTLESGYYDALILELGSGTGDNWWCVVYPPLCFTDTSVKYEYRSKLIEIVKNFKNRKESK